jgi:hypothetical protein
MQIILLHTLELYIESSVELPLRHPLTNKDSGIVLPNHVCPQGESAPSSAHLHKDAPMIQSATIAVLHFITNCELPADKAE